MKRIANMMDARMPDPPSVGEFEAVLRNLIRAPEDTVDALLGEIPTEGEPKKLCAHYKSAVRAFLEYRDVCAARNAHYSSLDECLLGWARWVVDVKELYVDPDVREKAMLKRTELAGTEPYIFLHPGILLTGDSYRPFSEPLPARWVGSHRHFFPVRFGGGS